MRRFLKLAFAATALVTALNAAPPGIRQVIGTSGDRDVTAAEDPHASHFTVRETQIDLDFPSGMSGKGSLLLVFEPTSGYYYWNIEWQKDGYPNNPQLEYLNSGAEFIAVTAGGLSILDVGNPLLFIREASDKAGSVEAAQHECLKRAAENIGAIEARKNLYRKAYIDLRGGWPPGFLPEEPRSEPGLPMKLVDATHKSEPWSFFGRSRTEGRWILTYEAGYKVKVTVADGVTCAASQMGCPGTISGLTCIDENGHDKGCPQRPR